MGMFDTAKMIQKAMQARGQLSKIKAVGKGGSLGVIVDGTYSFPKTEVDREELTKELGPEFTPQQIEKVARLTEKNVFNAAKDAKKALENEMKNNTSLDQFKDILGGM